MSGVSVKSSTLRLLQWNVRSCNSVHAAQVSKFAVDNDVDIILLQEVWWKDDKKPVGELPGSKIGGYWLVNHCCREVGNGGGWRSSQGSACNAVQV
jgi:exonuclease III